MNKYSVLMTIYKNDNPDYLEECLNSMLNQTIKTDDYVIVCDGPITEELEKILEKYVKKNKKLFNVIRLKENVGLGKALSVGVLKCKNDLIARIDDDDISHFDRCEKQINYIYNHPDIDIVSSYVNEFETNSDYQRVKKVPITNEEILKYSRRRNPFNHSAVMVKKSKLLRCGNYSEMRTNQDVDTWIRMLNNGCKGANIPEALVEFRFDRETYKRRKSFKNVKLLIKVWRTFYKNGYCSFFDYLYVILVQMAILLIPSKILSVLYEKYR